MTKPFNFPSHWVYHRGTIWNWYDDYLPRRLNSFSLNRAQSGESEKIWFNKRHQQKSDWDWSPFPVTHTSHIRKKSELNVNKWGGEWQTRGLIRRIVSQSFPRLDKRRFICNSSTCPVRIRALRRGEKMEHRHGNMWKSIANHPSSQNCFFVLSTSAGFRDHRWKAPSTLIRTRGGMADHVPMLNKNRF